MKELLKELADGTYAAPIAADCRICGYRILEGEMSNYATGQAAHPDCLQKLKDREARKILKQRIKVL